MNTIYCFPQQVPILTLLSSGRWAALKALFQMSPVMTNDEIMGTLYTIVRGL